MILPEIEEPVDRLPLLQHLLKIWEHSVQATHDFLQEQDIIALRPVVEQALLQVERFAVVWYEGELAGFIGANQNKIELLFLNPEKRGQGLGRSLMQYAVAKWQCRQVDVNEQNGSAAGFYQHLGFVVKSRSSLDEQGNPFPILHLEL